MTTNNSISMPEAGGRARRRGGFALLITITLLAFLVMLLVSLASLTRVETQVASNNAQLAQARANAIFALNLAIGQLQRHAGPDQRVTARADITADVQTKQKDNEPSNPLWTGVWDATPPNAAAPTHAAAPASADPVAWLVSGNETNGVALKPSTAPVAVPAAANDSVWLLRKAAGNDLTDLTKYPADLGVRLEKSLIKVPAANVPGASASGGDVTTGAYAWWVGDEGVKAKINLADPYRSAAVGDPEAAWRREAGPRPDLKLLSKPEFAGVFASTATTFETARTGMLSYEQMPMLDSALAAGAGMEQAGGYYHDLTTLGRGVLVDTLRGGLRRDLTRGLATAPVSGSVAAMEIGDAMAIFTLPAPGSFGRTAASKPSSPHVWTSNAEPPAPTWGALRAWAGLRVDSNNTLDPVAAPLEINSAVSSACPVPAAQAVVPVLVTLELGYGIDVAPDSKVRIIFRPVVVLMNPYNVALRSASYSVVYRATAASGKSNLAYSLTPSGDYYGTDSAGNPIAPPPAFTTDVNLTGTGRVISIDGVPQMAFNITDSFGPGETKVYSLPASAGADILIDSTASIMDLEPGISTVRAYWDSKQTLSWYDSLKRNKITAQLGHMPQDSPYFTLSLGKAVPGAMPTPTLYARYVATTSDIYEKPYPKASLASGSQGQLRTLRFSLRHADMDEVVYGTSDTAAQGTLGMNISTDTASGSRFLIDNNPRAVLSQRLCGRDGVAQFMVSSIKVANYTDLDYDDAGGAALAFWGGGIDALAGSNRSILFDVPRDGEQIVSLGRLGQFNWGVDGKHPAYPLGNSFASIWYSAGSPDFGYALNEALWDRFFFSTLPASLATRPSNLPASRLRFHDPAGATGLSALEGANGYQLSATRLTVDGAFNVNSTSVEAWAAFLGSVQAADYAYKTQAAANRTDSAVRAFPRVRNLHDADPTASGQSGNMYEWTGYRALDAAQLKALATQIVAGIKARARPARSLAEFMNRDLSEASIAARNKMGVVQAAIDATINTAVPSSGGASVSGLPGLNPAKVVQAAFSGADNPDAARDGLRSAGAPGFLLQSDLLSPLAPAMAARSDTFRVRTYGEALNPVTGAVAGRVWLEAVVQRMPEFVGGEAAELRLDDPALGVASKAFGRRFVITGFRWLGPDEI